MRAERHRLETALVCLRDPLSRISLAAGHLEDLALSGDTLSRTIQEAVAEIDLRLEDTLASLRRTLGPDDRHVEACATIEELVAELRPALEARGLALEVELPGQGMLADAITLRRVVCRMLLGVGRWMDDCTGSVGLALRPDGEGLGVCVEARVARGRIDETRGDVLAPLRGFALGEEICVEVEEDARAGEARLCAWIGREASA